METENGMKRIFEREVKRFNMDLEVPVCVSYGGQD